MFASPFRWGFFISETLIMINLIEQLKKHEGFRSDYYLCTADKKTIGYGRNVDNNPFSAKELIFLGRDDFSSKPMTTDEAETLLLNDVNEIIALIKAHLPWADLCPARKAVCVNMAFNIGISGFFQFKNMLRAIKNNDYEQAAVEMLDSLWARQVSGRAIELAVQMKSGVWQ